MKLDEPKQLAPWRRLADQCVRCESVATHWVKTGTFEVVDGKIGGETLMVLLTCDLHTRPVQNDLTERYGGSTSMPLRENWRHWLRWTPWRYRRRALRALRRV